MTTAKKAKNVGFKSLKEVAEIQGVTTRTLRRWDKESPERFRRALKEAMGKVIDSVLTE